MSKPKHVKLLDEWMRSYRPQEPFDADGRLRPEIAALAPVGGRRAVRARDRDFGAALPQRREAEYLVRPCRNGGLLKQDSEAAKRRMPPFIGAASGSSPPPASSFREAQRRSI
jgi:hypothetical protein